MSQSHPERARRGKSSGAMPACFYLKKWVVVERERKRVLNSSGIKQHICAVSVTEEHCTAMKTTRQ